MPRATPRQLSETHPLGSEWKVAKSSLYLAGYMVAVRGYDGGDLVRVATSDRRTASLPKEFLKPPPVPVVAPVAEPAPVAPAPPEAPPSGGSGKAGDIGAVLAAFASDDADVLGAALSQFFGL